MHRRSRNASHIVKKKKIIEKLCDIEIKFFKRHKATKKIVFGSHMTKNHGAKEIEVECIALPKY